MLTTSGPVSLGFVGGASLAAKVAEGPFLGGSQSRVRITALPSFRGVGELLVVRSYAMAAFRRRSLSVGVSEDAFRAGLGRLGRAAACFRGFESLLLLGFSGDDAAGV